MAYPGFQLLVLPEIINSNFMIMSTCASSTQRPRDTRCSKEEDQKRLSRLATILTPISIIRLPSTQSPNQTQALTLQSPSLSSWKSFSSSMRARLSRINCRGARSTESCNPIWKTSCMKASDSMTPKSSKCCEIPGLIQIIFRAPSNPRKTNIPPSRLSQESDRMSIKGRTILYTLWTE